MTETRALPIELESTAFIRFQDCDPFGHLNNARYVDYFMNARQDQLTQFYDFRLFEHGKPMTESWVVSRSYLAYLAPVSLAEEIRIRTRLIEFTQHWLVVEGLMLDAEGRRLKSIAWIEFTYFSLATGRPATHPDELMQLFGAVVAPGTFDEDGFNRRVAALRAEFRARREAQEAAA